MGHDRLLDRCGRVVTDAVLLSRFSQIDAPPVRIQISAQHQLNAVWTGRDRFVDGS